MLSFLPALVILQAESEIDLGFMQFVREHRGKALGDPVGKQYSRVQILRENRPFQPVPIEMEAWIDPKNPKEALFWNGLTYPIQKILGPGNLDAAKKRATLVTWGGGEGFWQPTDYFRSNEQPTPGSLAIWYMLGEVEIAQKQSGMARHYGMNQPQTLTSALAVWLGMGYRQKFAHAFLDMRDAEALKALEIEAQLPLTEQLPHSFSDRLAKDLIPEVRRHMSKASNPPAETKQEMIRNLEDIRSLGTWILPNALVFEQIRAQGTEIVPELIHAFKSDKRLTRAANMYGGSSRSVATVSSVAYSFLRAAWPEADYYVWFTEEELQDRWKSHANLIASERVLAILRDPSINDQQVGNIISALSDSTSTMMKRSLSFRLELDRLRPQISDVVRRRATDQVQKFSVIPVEDHARSGAFREALHFVTTVSAWDYQVGQDSLRVLIRAAKAGWEKPSWLHPREVMSAIQIGLRNGDEEMLAVYQSICDREDRTENWLVYALPGLQIPPNRNALSIARRVVSSAESLVRSNPKPSKAVRTVENFFRYDPSQNLSYPAIRKFVSVALESKTYLLVEGGPNYRTILDDGYHFSLTLPKGGQDLMRLFVGDLTAHHLCQLFETGVDFSFYESEEKRAQKRKLVAEWLSKLPNEPVPRKEQTFKRRSSSPRL